MTRTDFLLRRLVLVGGDYAVFTSALFLALVLRDGGHIDPRHFQAHLIPFAILWTVWIAVFYINGLYEPAAIQDRLRLFRGYLEAMVANLVIGFAFFYLIPVFGIAPRTNLFLHFAVALLLGYGWRVAYNAKVFPSLFRNRVLFVGKTEDAAAVGQLLKEGRVGYTLAATVVTDGGNRPEGMAAWSGRLADLPELLERARIQTLVVGHRTDEVPGLADALYPSLFSRISLIDRATLEESVTGRVPLEHVSQLWFLEHLHEQEKAWIDGAKRIIDIVLAIPFGLLTLVLMPFVALAIRLSSPGPIFIRQTRIGKLNKPFTLIKFRSMHALSPDGSAETKGAQFTQDAKTDPRLFPVGRFLRQTRIDEFPQIWNVLRGDLSFVGPRPERPEFVEPLQAKMPFYALRHLVRPGLTGWAQVRYLTPVARLDDNLVKLRYDLYYIRHRSLLLDFAILLKTVGIMLRRQGT